MEQSSWNGGHWNCKRESKASSSGASCQSHDTTPARHDQQNPFPRHFHKNMNAFHSGSLCHFVPVRVGSLCRERSFLSFITICLIHIKKDINTQEVEERYANGENTEADIPIGKHIGTGCLETRHDMLIHLIT